MQMGLGSMEMDTRIRRESALLEAHALTNSEGLRAQLVGFYNVKPAERAGKNR